MFRFSLAQGLTAILVFKTFLVAQSPDRVPASASEFLGLPSFSQGSSPSDQERDLVALWDLGHKKEAHRLTKELIKKDRKSAQPWILSAVLSHKEGRYKRCLSQCDKALARSPESAQAFYWKGKAFEALKKPLEAANEYRAALVVRPPYPMAKEALEHVLAQLKAVDDRSISTNTSTHQ